MSRLRVLLLALLGLLVLMGASPVISSPVASALRTSGGTVLTMGAPSDGQNLCRSGTTIGGCAAGALSGLGSTDNAVLRADGTGGATAQGSPVVISDAGRIATYSGSALHAIYPPTVGTWTTGVASTILTVTDGNGSYDIYCYLDLTRTAGAAAAQQGAQVRVRALRAAGSLSIRHSAVSSYLGSYSPPYAVTASGDNVQLTPTSAGHSGEFMTACTLAYAAVDLES